MISRAAGWAAMVAFVACAGRQTVPPEPASPPDKPAAPPIATAPLPPAPPPALSVNPMAQEEGAIAEGELCLSCHSQELIVYARIGEGGWKAEMTKMRNWGAAVEESKAESFALWFARRYPASESAPPSAVITSAEAVSAVAPERGARAIRGDKRAGAAAYAKDCASCHGASAEGTGGGPVLVEAPVLYQPQRFAALTQKGKGRMPAFPALGRDDINNVLTYLRDLR